MDKAGKVGKFSNHGYAVDLAAPGVNLPSWCDATFRSYCSHGYGTSDATAIASASAALIWSAHPDWTANQVLRALIDTAGREWPKETPSNYLGYGIVRPRKVLENPHYNPAGERRSSRRGGRGRQAEDLALRFGPRQVPLRRRNLRRRHKLQVVRQHPDVGGRRSGRRTGGDRWRGVRRPPVTTTCLTVHTKGVTAR